MREKRVTLRQSELSKLKIFLSIAIEIYAADQKLASPRNAEGNRNKYGGDILGLSPNYISTMFNTNGEYKIHREKFEKLRDFLDPYFITSSEPRPDITGFDLQRANYPPFINEITEMFTKEKIAQENNKRRNFVNPILSALQNTTWYCYERKINDTIGIKLINFKEMDDDVLEVSWKSAEENILPWEGEARCVDRNMFLIITMLSDSSTGYTHYMIRISEGRTDMNLFIGHMTFNDINRNNVVTKMVVFHKVNLADVSNARSAIVSISSESILPQIKAFLFERNMNRMPSPHEAIITNLQDFSNWLNQNVYKQFGESLAPPGYLLGSYLLCYRAKPLDSELLTIDTLTISHLAYSHHLQIDYSHKPVRGRQLQWEGSGQINFHTRTLTIYLHGPDQIASGKIEKDKPIFLMLSLPTEEQESIEVLTGVIAGNRDSDKGTVARLIIAVRTDEAALSQQQEKIIGNFFNAYTERCWVRPPTEQGIYHFVDIEHSLEEGSETQHKIFERYKAQIKPS